jgi:excalibur calcium-binding domain-containing protein
VKHLLPLLILGLVVGTACESKSDDKARQGVVDVSDDSTTTTAAVTSTTAKPATPTTTAKAVTSTTAKPTTTTTRPATTTTTEAPTATTTAVYYANCDAARAAGAAPIYRGQPGYRSGLDRDGDGIACDKS